MGRLPDHHTFPLEVRIHSHAAVEYRKFKRPFLAVCRVGGGRASGGLGKDRTCASALRHHVGAQPGRPWPFLTQSRQRAKRAPAGSPPHLMAVGFRCWGAWPILRLRGHGHGRWPARSGAVVRFRQRVVLCEVGEDGCGFFDAGHDPYRTAAVDAGAHVDAKHALETLRPSHRTAAFVGSAAVCARLGRFRFGGGTFAAPRWRQLRAQVRVWRTNSPGAN